MDLRIVAPHTGQSSQLFLDYNHRNARFLTKVAISVPQFFQQARERKVFGETVVEPFSSKLPRYYLPRPVFCPENAIALF